MKSKRLITLCIGAVLLMPAGGVLAQNTQDQTKPGMMDKNMTGMMEMMGMIGQMTAQHQDMSDLMKKLTQSLAAIQSEKDPSALKSKLAEHAALLDQMRSKMMQHQDMMQKMSGMMPGMMSGMMDGMMSGMMDAMKKAESVAKAPTAPDETDHNAHHPEGAPK